MIGITRKQLRELHEEAQKLRELGAVTVLPPEPKKTGVTAFLYPERSAKGVFGEALYADVLFYHGTADRIISRRTDFRIRGVVPDSR